MDIQKCEKIWEIKPQNYNLLPLLMCGQATDQQTEEWGRVAGPSRLEAGSLQEETIHHGDHTVSKLSLYCPYTVSILSLYTVHTGYPSW